jgi:hypothetical protein
VFCAQAGLEAEDASLASVVESLERARARGADEVTFVGGEPTLVPALDAMVAAAKRAGFVKVGIQTNGSRLSERAEALAHAGATDVHLSIHGARADVHDFHTGREGSFARARDGTAAARRAGLDVVVTTVLTRSSYRVLAELDVLLSSAGAAAFAIELPVARGRAEESFDRVMPRLALALPFALHALARIEKRGIAAFIRGAPICLLGPFAARALPSEARAFGAACASCPARDACPGVDAEYLARFEGDELRARSDTRIVAPTERERALARMFVGPGELAPARPARGTTRLRVVG